MCESTEDEQSSSIVQWPLLIVESFYLTSTMMGDGSKQEAAMLPCTLVEEHRRNLPSKEIFWTKEKEKNVVGLCPILNRAKHDPSSL